MDDEEFLKHLRFLKEDTQNISNPRLYLIHPSCKAIISEGRRIIPTILKYYRTESYYLDIILTNIIGYKEYDWIEWGKNRGYINK